MIDSISVLDSLFVLFVYIAVFVALVLFVERLRLYFYVDFVVRLRLQR